VILDNRSCPVIASHHSTTHEILDQPSSLNRKLTPISQPNSDFSPLNYKIKAGYLTFNTFQVTCKLHPALRASIMRVNQHATQTSMSAYSNVEEGENWRENEVAVSRIACSKRTQAMHAAAIGCCLYLYQRLALIEMGPATTAG
jgi:hypothetical protein